MNGIPFAMSRVDAINRMGNHLAGALTERLPQLPPVGIDLIKSWKSMTRSNLVGWLTRVSPGLLSHIFSDGCTT